MAEDDAVLLIFVVEEGTKTDSERFDFDEVRSGAENTNGREGVFVGCDCVGAGSDGSDGGNIFDTADGFNIGEVKVGLSEGVAVGEFFDGIGDGIFVGSGADNDKVSADFSDFLFDEIIDGAHEGEDEDDGGYTNRDAETGEKGTSVIFLDGGFGEFEVSAEK